jgi:hypothetical protein
MLLNFYSKMAIGLICQIACTGIVRLIILVFE